MAPGAVVAGAAELDPGEGLADRGGLTVEQALQQWQQDIGWPVR